MSTPKRAAGVAASLSLIALTAVALSQETARRPARAGGRGRRGADAARRPGHAARAEEDRARPLGRVRRDRRPRPIARRSRASPRRGETPASTSTATRSTPSSRCRRSRRSMKADVAAKPEGHGRAAEAARSPLQPRAQARPARRRCRAASRSPSGPTARLARGHDLGQAGRDEPRGDPQRGRLPVPVAAAPQAGDRAARSSRRCRSTMFPRLERFDVDFDLPDAFLPEFPPAIFLQNRPELGDVSRGEVVSINNFYRLFKDILTPVQLDGLRLLLTPFPQEEFNPTDDRKSAAAEPGRHLPRLPRQRPHHRPVPPQPRRSGPQQRRFRLDTVSLRGVFNQQIHGSKRSLRSVEDFTEFEQRTAYFNGDPIHAMKKGFIDPRPRPGHATWPRCRTCSTSRPPRSSTRDGPARPDARRPRASCAARSSSSARRSARLPPGAALPRPPDARPAPGAVPRTSRATARSRPSRSAASRTARPTCTTAAA